MESYLLLNLFTQRCRLMNHFLPAVVERVFCERVRTFATGKQQDSRKDQLLNFRLYHDQLLLSTRTHPPDFPFKLGDTLPCLVGLVM